MLFDLRGRGRRRTVQGIYLFLAVLIGGGLVGFGIGGNVSGGGLLDALKGGGGSSGAQIDQFERSAEKQVKRHPRSRTAWAALAQARFTAAGQGTGYDVSRASFTAAGRAKLAQAAQAWERYLALHPPRPSVRLAQVMAQAFSPQGLNQPARAVQAVEVITSAQPRNANAFVSLAVYAYQAGQSRKADLAARRAVELTPRGQRAQVSRTLAAAKAQAAARRARTGRPPAPGQPGPGQPGP